MRKEIRIRILLGYGTLYAMRRHKAWRGGSKAPQSGEPATALAQKSKCWVNSWSQNGPKLATN